MPSQEEIILAAIRNDSYATMKYLGGFDHVPMHRDWHTIWNHDRRSAIEAPVGHSKSYNFVYHVAWKIGFYYFRPYLWIKYFTNSFTNSKFRVNMIADIINTYEYNTLFPWVKPDKKSYNKEYLDFIRPYRAIEPVLRAVGFEAKITGTRTTDLYCDDVVDFENAISVPISEYQIQKFNTDFLNRLMPEAWLGCIYTTFTNWDLNADIERNNRLPVHKWNYRNYEKDGKLLMPKFWTKEAIERKRIEEPEAWKQGFLLMPLSSDMVQIFFREDFHFVENYNISSCIPDIALDIATGTTGRDDLSYAISYNFGDLKYFHDIQIMNVKIDVFLECIEKLDTQFNFGIIWYESNAVQKIIGDILPRNIKFKGQPTFTSLSKKMDVNTGMKAMAAAIRNRKIIFNKTISDEIIKQFVVYGLGSGKDDAVMSSWMVWENQCNKKEYFVI